MHHTVCSEQLKSRDKCEKTRFRPHGSPSIRIYTRYNDLICVYEHKILHIHITIHVPVLRRVNIHIEGVRLRMEGTLAQKGTFYVVYFVYF